MENIVDERIRSLARQSDLTVPGDYERNIEQLLNRLMAKEKMVPIRRYRGSKKVAAVIACCILFGSGGAYAAYNYANLRMQQMKPDEIADLKKGIQTSTENADCYSRKLSDSEQNRLVKLTTQYDSEGVFPKGKILEVDSVDGIIRDRLCFVASTSTFYLPKKEMTDEQLLELIDFYSKRDYSIKQKDTQKSSDRNTEVLLGESAAVTKAADSIQELYGVDVSQMEYSVSKIDGGSGTEQKMMAIEFCAAGNTTYQVTLDTPNNQIVMIYLTNDKMYNTSTASDKEEFQNQYASVKSFLQHLLTSGQSIRNSYLTYFENKNTLVKNGVLTYFFALSDGSGYELNYSCAERTVFGIRFVRDTQSNPEWNKKMVGQDKQSGYELKTIQLQ